MKHLIGLDIGTTGVKGVLVTDRGRVLAAEFREYPLSLPKPGWAEQDPEHWWQATVASLRGLLATSGVSPKSIAGLSLSGQMHGLVCLDGEDRVLRPAILWCDTRTTAQCRRIEEAVGGRPRLIQLACNPALEGFTLPKLIWVREHEPEAVSYTHLTLPTIYSV